MTSIGAEVWKRLSVTAIAGDALVARPATGGKSRLLASVDLNGRRHFLVKLLPSEKETADQRSRGVDLETRQLTLSDGTSGRYLVLACNDPLGHEVFDSIGSDLASVLDAGVEEPGVAAKRLLAKWRRFWQPAGGQLSREAQLGLFAELWFLAYWLVPKVGIQRAVDAWKGPTRGTHDFEMSTVAIEVKATTVDNGRKHLINGIDQLAVQAPIELLLFSLSLREEASAANTVGLLATRVRDLAKNDDASSVRFESHLAAVGYDARAESDEIRIRVVDERLYSVSADFPRVTRAMLSQGVPQGVGTVSYVVDLAGFDRLVLATTPTDWNSKMVK